MGNLSRKELIYILTAAILLMLGVGVVWGLRSFNNSKTGADNGSPALLTSAKAVQEVFWSYDLNGPIPPTPVGCQVYGSLVFISPRGNRFIVPNNAAEVLNPCNKEYPDQMIMGMILSDPLNPDSVDIVTFGCPDSMPDHCLVSDTARIYTYNLADELLNLVYTTKIPNAAQFVLEAIGTQGSKLILRTQIRESGDPCQMSFYDATGLEHYYSLDLRSPGSGLQDYQVPAVLSARDAARRATCINELNSNP